jgi:LSD1 subclass zinc finger protein
MSGHPPQKLWGLALAGILTEMNSAHHHELGMWGRNANTVPWCTNSLRDFYGVEDKASFDEMAHWLATAGHSAAARETIANLGPNPIEDEPKESIARAYRQLIERQGLLAWDVGRLVAVTGWAYWAGYVDEDEAWKIILGSAKRVQQTYDSWRAYADAYMLGRLYWSGGVRHEGTQKAYTKLLGDPSSPWNRLPWGLDLGAVSWDPASAGGKAKTRFKRSVCPSCGGHKTRPSLTAYVYCDFCGALADFDFQKACEKPAERPGPAYENLNAQIAPVLAQAKMRGDVQTFRQYQMQLFDAFVTMTPASCPPRVSDPRYRHAYVAYMAEGAVASAFDPVSLQHEANVNRTVQSLQFASPKPGVIKVSPQSFHALVEAVFAQQDHLARVHEARGVYAMHPDRAPAELQRRIGISMFVQGWLPMLDEASSQAFLQRAGLKSEYVEVDPPPGDKADCASCGHHLEILPGARRIVCEKCGQGLEVGGERVTCRGCGSPLAPPEGSTNVTCPHCKNSFQRVQMMRPG